MSTIQKRHKNPFAAAQIEAMIEGTFAVNEGETEAEGVLRISKIMQLTLKYWNPETSNNNMLKYSLVRTYKQRVDSISQSLLMKYVLQHEEVADVYTKVNEIVETPMYKVAIAMLDDGYMF